MTYIVHSVNNLDILTIIEGRLKWAEREAARSEAKKDEALF